MKYEKIPREELIRKIEVFESELRGYVDRVDQRYKIFFERNLAGMYRTRLSGEIVECNDALAQILGYDSKEELIGKDARILYKDVNDREKHLNLLKKHKFVRNRKLSLLKKDGTQIWVSISTSEISHPTTDKTEYLEGTIIDITELIRTQELLAKSEDNFRQMLEQSPYGIIIHKGGKVCYANGRAAEIIGQKLDIKTDIKKLFPTDLIAHAEEEITGEIQHYNRMAIGSKSKKKHVDLYVKTVYFENERMTEFSFVDVEDQIKLEEEKLKSEVFQTLNDQLKQEIKEKEKIAAKFKKSLDTNLQQAAKLEAIFENKSHVIWTMNRRYELTSFNKHFADLIIDLYGFQPRLKDKPLQYKFVGKETQQELWEQKLKGVFQGEALSFVSHLRGKDQDVFLQIYLNPIFDVQKNVIEFSGIGHDITAKERAENKLTESLREKDILLKEIHHRVKNNLQVISSIFNLQIAFNKDDRIRDIFKESQNRIKSMAYIHESLYKSTELGNIDFEEYLNRLAKNLIQSYTLQDLRVTLLNETEKVFLHLDQAIPCGLIVNEVISNSLKYAFDGRESGIIMISLKKVDNNVVLRLADDGVGLSDNQQLVDSNTLGFHLIFTLVEQLRGEMKVDGNNGTSITIEFPMTSPRKME